MFGIKAWKISKAKTVILNSTMQTVQGWHQKTNPKKTQIWKKNPEIPGHLDKQKSNLATAQKKNKKQSELQNFRDKKT